MNRVVILDLEGVLTPPGTDFAEAIVRHIGDDAYRLFKYFDAYDDYRWIREYMSKTGNYQTGTTPFYALLISYAYGLSENDIRRLAKELATKVALEEFRKIVNELSKKFKIIIVTSSYFVFSHEVCRRLGIELDNVYSTCNTRIDNVVEEHVLDILEEIASREKVRKVVDNIARISLNIISENLPLNSIDEYINSIDNVKLRNYLYNRLVLQRGIAGSRFKAGIVKKFRENSLVIFVGDSIVDSEAASVANASISINTTCIYLLYSSSINVVTEDYTKLIDVIELAFNLIEGKVPNRNIDSVVLYFSNDIIRNANSILEVNRNVREKVKLKLLYNDPIFRLETL